MTSTHDASGSAVYRLLAWGRLSDEPAVTAFSALLRNVRRHGESSRVGGAILFDGERVLLGFEGSPAPVKDLVGQLHRTPQLTDGLDELASVSGLTHSAADSGWRSGYVEADVIDQLVARGVSTSDRAEALFVAFDRAVQEAEAQ